MKLTTFLAALALTFMPALAFAQCMGKDQQATMTCAEGTQWDAASQTCVPVTSS